MLIEVADLEITLFDLTRSWFDASKQDFKQC